MALEDLGVAPSPESPGPATTPPPAAVPAAPGEGGNMQEKQTPTQR